MASEFAVVMTRVPLARRSASSPAASPDSLLTSTLPFTCFNCATPDRGACASARAATSRHAAMASTPCRIPRFMLVFILALPRCRARLQSWYGARRYGSNGSPAAPQHELIEPDGAFDECGTAVGADGLEL